MKIYHNSILPLCHLKNAAECLSAVNVCSEEANSLQRALQNECFSSWQEKCDIQQYIAVDVSRMDELLQMISSKMAVCDKDIRNKLNAITFCQNFEQQVFEFTYGESLSEGVIHFGIVAISKDDDVVSACSCLYTLNFELGRMLVTKTTNNTFLGIDIGTETESWTEKRKLGCVTKEAIVNLCRYKALQEFHKRNLISRINCVKSLNDV